MQFVSWPAAVVLSVCAVCVTVLVARGSIPAHVATMLLGAAVGYAAPRAASGASALLAARRSRDEAENKDVP